MAADILTAKVPKVDALEGEPSSCADGVLTASKHLGGSDLVSSVIKTVSPEYTETTIRLSGRATPADCANCIGKYCLLPAAREGKVNGDAVHATRSKLINHEPRERVIEEYKKLEDQAAYFELREQLEQDDALNLSTELTEQGANEAQIIEMGLPVVDLDAIHDVAA